MCLAELRVGLMPIKPEAARYSTVEFKCDYRYGHKMYIYFRLLPYNGLPLTAWTLNEGSFVTTNYGGYRLWNVYVGQHPCNVECSFLDRYGSEMATISTTITPGWAELWEKKILFFRHSCSFSQAKIFCCFPFCFSALM